MAAAGTRENWAEICSVDLKGFPLSTLSPVPVCHSSGSTLGGARAFYKGFHLDAIVINISSVDLKN